MIGLPAGSGYVAMARGGVSGAVETVVSAVPDCAEGIELWWMQGNDHYPEFRPSFTEAALGWLFDHPGGG